jgi:hypothetical protein
VVYFGGIALNIAIAYINKSQLPWWGVILAILMSTVLSLPLNMITAITGTGFGLNVFAEMICGFVLPGLPGLYISPDDLQVLKLIHVSSG